MKINLTFRYSVAFIAYIFFAGQLHEMAHLTAAYFICHAPGIQADFNLWTLCPGCEQNPDAYLASIAGPLFSYCLMWAGFFMLRSDNRKYWPAAFVLVLGNLAFARIITAAMGGGDETTVLRILLGNHLALPWVKALGFLMVFGLAFPPIYMCYKRLEHKSKLLMLLACGTLPLPVMWLYEFRLLGKVIQSGFLAERSFLGIADFIHLHTVIMGIVVAVLYGTLFYNTNKKPQSLQSEEQLIKVEL